MEYPVKEFKDQQAFESWLEANPTSDGIWIKLAKKGSGKTTVSYAEAVESALCYGWIDSQTKTFDEKFYIQKFTPRRSKSVWSKINVKKAEALIKAGRIRPAGLAQIEAAKADGRWTAAYEGSSTAEAPEDFLKALAKNKKATAFYETLSKSNKYAIIWRLHHSKKPETRQANIEKFINMLAEGKSFH
ncbi:MAG TPA: YdeI/OmpD-associated family protein [Chitinophagaceae bacterium]|nr:YdeI/OmpD-associated family protein [Chitinophagaceae bacterium]